MPDKTIEQQLSDALARIEVLENDLAFTQKGFASLFISKFHETNGLSDFDISFSSQLYDDFVYDEKMKSANSTWTLKLLFDFIETTLYELDE